MSPLEKEQCLGSWYTNRKNMVRFFNQYNDSVSLKGDNSIAGKYLGLVNKETDELAGCCEIKVRKVEPKTRLRHEERTFYHGLIIP